GSVRPRQARSLVRRQAPRSSGTVPALPRADGRMMSIGVVYVGLLIAGVVYAVISGFLGWVSDLAGDIHLDVTGHLAAGHMHPISGPIVATFVTGFGGGGTVSHYVLRWSLVPGLLLALGSGLALAIAAFVTLELIFKQTEAGSEFGAHSLADREAE